MASVILRTLLLLAVVLLFSPSAAWKKDEFRTCDQTPFCKRARHRAPHSLPSPLSLSSLSLSDDGSLSAVLSSSSSPRPLILRLSLFDESFLRLEIDEDYSVAPLPYPPRFRIASDVLIPSLESHRLHLSRVSDPVNGVVTVPFGSGLSVSIATSPFALSVLRDGSPVLSFNSHGLFDFEQRLAEKPEGDTWEEHWRSHTDSRPRGPQSISFDVSFHGIDFVYGIPEHGSESLVLKPTRGPGVDMSEPYRMFNLDVFEYLHESPFGLYGSIPVMIGHGGQHASSSGFFWMNTAEMQIDVLSPGWDESVKKEEGRIDTLWMSEAGVVDAFFFLGPEPKDVMRQYASVTGASALPQLFAIAYHQCRWNYRDEEDVDAVDAGFDEHDVPYDVIWLDIEHTERKKYFTWDKVLFPDPEGMQRRISSKGRRMVTIVDPHIFREEGFELYKEATEMGYLVKDASGKDYDGWCWPGSSSYPDVVNPEIRDWFSNKFLLENYKGSTLSLYTWNDMNEPSVFNGPEVSMPRDALHHGNIEHREVHNAYGYYFHMASANGLLKRGNGKDRPFVLSRSFFAGSQQVGAIWTGDNTADWDHLKSSVPMILNLGLTGMSFSGADIGGFFGNPEPELLVRWYQLGAFYPFYRAHAHHDTRRREPWLFGERRTSLIREALHVRYSLLPYFYTLAREASVSGIPVMRPIWVEFPLDKKTYDIAESFMVGPSILVQGIFQEGQKSTTVYLPGSQMWYDLRDGTAYRGSRSYELEVSEESIPYFQRAGTIIPRKDRFRRSSTQMANDPFTLVIALNSSLAAEGELYLDDGKSFDYKDGAFIHRRFVFADQKLTSSATTPVNTSGKKFSSNCVIERIIFLGSLPGAKKAIIEPSNREAAIELGPLNLRPGANSIAVTVRRPDVRIDDDWTIRIV